MRLALTVALLVVLRPSLVFATEAQVSRERLAVTWNGAHGELPRCP